MRNLQNRQRIAGSKFSYVETSFPVTDSSDTQPVDPEFMDECAARTAALLEEEEMPSKPVVGCLKIWG